MTNNFFIKLRCRNCNQIKKGVSLPFYNLKLCFDCFVSFFKKRIQRTIERFKMFSKEDKIVVAVSGGKDSIALAKVLKELGYNISLVHINCKIEENDYSIKSQQKVEEFAQKENLSLRIIDLKKEIGVDIKTASKIAKKKICAVCGMIRRYLLNKNAKEFDVLCTGHTLDDEVGTLLSSLIFWKEEFLQRQYPILKEEQGLKRKAKPLCFTFEKETEIFCKILNLPYLSSRCPFRKGSYVFFKEIIKKINEQMPSSILNFYKGFLKRKRRFAFLTKNNNLAPCEKCGYLTSAKICSFCRLKEKIRIYLQK